MTSFGYLLPTRGTVLASDDPSSLAARTDADVLGLARRAESLGYDSVWVGDSVVARPRHEPLVTLGSVAGATESIGIGTAVYLPALRHPVHVAHQTATLDQLSGGRLAIGVGVGGGPPVANEHEQFDVPFGSRGRVLDEALEIVTSLWSGDAVTFDGEFFSIRDASLGFEPCAEIPIYVASAFDPQRGFPRPILDRLAAHGDGWFPTRLSPRRFEAGYERVLEAAADAGRDADAIGGAYYLNVVVADSEEAALDRAMAFHEAYYPGQDHQRDRLRRQGAYGTPDDIADRIDEFADAGVETFVVRFPAENQREQLHRFADRFA